MAFAVLGMRGTGSYAAGERPENWRQAILLLFPSGDAPLTAILSKMRESPTDDPRFHWFEKPLPEQRALLAGVSTTLTSAPATNSTVAANDSNAYLALRVRPGSPGLSADDTSIYKPGHLLYNQVADETVMVIKKASTGGTDYLIVLRNVGNKYTLGTNNPAWTGNTADGTGDHVVINGSSFPEGASIGQSVAYSPVAQFNYAQIFRTPLFMTRTARKMKLRYDAGGGYAEAKRESLQLHAIEMEKAFLFSERSENTSFNNPDAPLDVTSASQPARTTRGVLNWLPAITSGSSPTVHWNVGVANGGALTEALWDSYLEQVMKFGSREKLGLCGATFLTVLAQLTKNKATIEMVPQDNTYGMALMRYICPFGTIYFILHPIMSNDPIWTQDLFVIDVDKLTFRYVDDTTFLRNRQSPGDDATKDEWLTEAGLEMHFTGCVPDQNQGLPTIPMPASHGRLKGVQSYGG
jgi:hypothetical protein